jgi:hypothetical protein
MNTFGLENGFFGKLLMMTSLTKHIWFGNWREKHQIINDDIYYCSTAFL